MAFNPANTKWSVAPLDNDGKLGAFHPTLWEFHQEAMNAGTLWAGGYHAVPNSDDRIACEILNSGSAVLSDSFEVVFVTEHRFIATKGGSLYRFGKR